MITSLKSDRGDEGFETYEYLLVTNEHKLVQKWYNKFSSLSGTECYSFQNNDLTTLPLPSRTDSIQH